MNDPFVLRVLDTAGQVFWRPSVLGLSAAGMVCARLAFDALDADRGFWNVPRQTMVLMAVVAIARSWLSFCVAANALATIRRDAAGRPAARLIVWVTPMAAFEAGFVSLALAIPTLACLVFLIVPGVILALRWSQTLMLILDRQAAWFESAEASVALTDGRRLDILLVWAILGGLFAVVMGLMTVLPAVVDWGLLLGANTFALAVMAAVYHHSTEG